VNRITAAVNAWLTRWAPTWWEEEAKASFPHFEPADEVFSEYHGWIGQAIIFFAKLWSHESKYIGGGCVAEATTPVGRVATLGNYMDMRHSLEVWRFPDDVLARHAKIALCKQAVGVIGKKYDYDNILAHAVDAICNWAFGRRPFASHGKDADGTNRLECSEWAGWTWFFTFGKPFNPGKPESQLPAVKPGWETPAQNYARMKEMGAILVFKQVRGRVKFVLGED
jgi:hypothetical protein